ncbi:MAG TPA: nucleoside 2-deoxyribosyltransferase [Candidatus Saccharimonadales bacterium]
MKICVTTRFKGEENKQDIVDLCAAVRAAGLEDFSFIRDIENYQKTFNDPKELWQRAKQEITQCDALLIDVSDNPSGGRVIEAGIAYALDMPIFVLVKKGLEYKDVYNGIATVVIKYEAYADVTKALRNFIEKKNIQK